MNCLVGGPLLVEGLQGPGPPGLPLKSVRGSNALLPRSRHHSYRLWSLLIRLHIAVVAIVHQIINARY